MVKAWGGIVALAWVLAPPAFADALGDAMIATANAPPGWQLMDEQRVASATGVPEAEAAARQEWSYAGEVFSIVYFSCADAARATALYERHARVLGAQAIVAPRGALVIELQRAPTEVWSDAAQLLGFDGAQRRKLIAAALPRGWQITREFLVPAAQVAQAGESLGAPIQSILVQQLDSPHGPVRVNFMLCADREVASRVYAGASPSAGLTTFVTLDGPVVIEIVADERAALLPALEVLETRPLHSAAGGN